MEQVFKKYSVFAFLMLLCAGALFSQNLDSELLESFNARNIGPAGMSGRITAIDVNPRNDDHIYVGSASGGVWESKNGGISWDPIFDETGVLSIGAIELNPSNPAEIWVGTGEGNPRNSHNSGAGIFFSNDAGNSWTFRGLKETRLIHRIIVDPTNSKNIYVGALGSAWGASPDRGVFRSTDGGETWAKSLYINEETGVADMVMDPSNPKKIIAALWEFGRKPWTFNSGGEGSGMHITYDGGDNWKEITEEEGLPEGDLGRIGLAFATNKPNIVYALVEATENGLYKSTDGGANWDLVSTENIGNRPFYYAELYVDPQNENRIYNVYTYLSKSEDGGKTFRNIADYGNNVHPDHHAFWIHPTNPDYLIDGNDGGLNISRDGGETWRFITNIPVGQFYHVNYDLDFPYNVYGGMQDNGSWGGPHTVFRRGGINNYDWQELFFGDGFDVVPDATNSRYGYAMSQGGNVARYDRETGRTQMVKPVHPDGTPLRFNWNAAISQDPFDPCGLYFGSQFVHYSSDCGVSWDVISPDLTTNDTTKQKQDISGGLTIDATNAENYTTLIAVVPSPVDQSVVWASSDDGRLHITRDSGKTWVDVSSRLTGMPKGAWLPQIEVSAKNAGEAFVVANDYRRNNWKAYAFHTTDYGQSWKQIIDDSKIGSFICSIVQDDEAENLLFAGADNGLYVSIDKGTNWTKWSDDVPPVQIRDIKIHPTEHDLILGTFGRALWVVDDIRPLQALAKDRDLMKQEFTLLPSPAGIQIVTASYQGVRFGGQGDFRAPTKRMSARINYYIPKSADELDEGVEPKKDEKDKKKSKKKKLKKAKKKSEKQQADTEVAVKDTSEEKDYDNKIRYYVIDQKGDTLRTQAVKAKEGFNYFGWRMDMKGVDWPSVRDRKRDADYEPGGPDVLPGSYKLVATYKQHKDSTMVEVKSDPRLEVDNAKASALVNRYQEFSQRVEAAADALDKLKAAKKTVQTLEGLSFGLEDDAKKELDSLNTEMSKQVQELIELYVMPEGLKGIQRNPKKLNSQLGTASWYLGSRWDEVGENTENILRQTSDAVEETVVKVNEFLNGPFAEYQEKVESLEFNLFKKMKEEK